MTINSADFNPAIMAQIGQNAGAQKVGFGGLSGQSRGGGQKVGGNDNAFAKEMAQVSGIGMSKKANFENGLGGTNQPVDANGRVCKSWIA